MRHRFHSICPYFAMFPEAFALDCIEAYSRPGDVVLDPFAGRGTTPFQALLSDREGVGVDVNPVAACLNRAKLSAPKVESARRRLKELKRSFQPEDWSDDTLHEFFSVAYTKSVLQALLYLRANLRWRTSYVDALLASLVMGALHGEASSKRYLSNQMPRTISTKPDYSVRFWRERALVAPDRDVFEVIETALDYRYASEIPGRRGRAVFGDMRDLARTWKGRPASLVVTSPPYSALTSYEEDQWLRLWFLGYTSRPRKAKITRDDRFYRESDYWNFIGDFWRSIAQVLEPRGKVVVRIGSTSSDPERLADKLAGSLFMCPREAEVIDVKITEIKRRQTDSFRPGSQGCHSEVDLHAMVY